MISEKKAEEILETFMETEPKPENPHVGRPTEEEIKAKEKSEREQAKQAIINEALPKLLVLAQEIIGIPWELWEDRIYSTWPDSGVDWSFVRLNDRDKSTVAHCSYPLIAKHAGTWKGEYAEEIICLAGIASVTIPRIMQLRKIERILRENAGKIPRQPHPTQPKAEQVSAPAPAPAPEAPKRRGRPKK
jgi:hypothetical protein